MSNRFQSLLPAHVQQLVAYDPGYEPSELKVRLGLKEMVELGSNENSFGPAAAVQAYLRNPQIPGFRYPDAGGRALKAALAQHYQRQAGQFTLGNGTHELLTLIAETFCNPGDEVLHARYGFAVYRLAALGAGATPVAAAVDATLNVSPEALLAAITERTKLVYLANPNNPTGTIWSQAQLEFFVARLPESVIFILDEAYIEYVDPALLGTVVADGLAIQASAPNLVLARTFSKAYGLASLRVGYTLAHAEFASVLERTRLSFNCNAIALKAAALALEDQQHIAWVRAQIALERAWVLEQLAALPIKVFPSVCNFVLLEFDRDAAPIEQALVQRGVIVRPMRAYQLPQHLRVTIGVRHENAMLLAALSEILSL